jgi:hemolysin III
MRLSSIIVRKNFSIGEEIANAITHCVGALLAIAAMVLLIVKGAVNHRGALYIVSMVIYSFTLLFLFLNSTLYHALVPATAKKVYQRFDHLSIYLLIAGTYMPFCLISIGGTLGIVMCSIQCGLAIIGVVFKAIWIDKYVKVHTLIFLTMGWMIIFMAKPLFVALGTSGLILLISGGLAYSIGTFFFLFDWFKYHHFIWHLFVLAGAVLHFFCLYLFV